MKRSIYRTLLLLPVLLAAAIISRAERGDTLINPYFEMGSIIANLTDTFPKLIDSYSMTDKVDSAGSHHYDTVIYHYKLAGEKYYTEEGHSVIVQNDLYNVTIDNDDSLIVIAPVRHLVTVLFKSDMLDSTFQGNFLDSIRVFDSAGMRRMAMTFKYSSPYYSYEIQYGPPTYGIFGAKIKMRNSIPLTPDSSYTITEPTTDYSLLTLSFLYLYAFDGPLYDGSVFNINKYFTRSGNVFTPATAYANYKIINQLPNQ